MTHEEITKNNILIDKFMNRLNAKSLMEENSDEVIRNYHNDWNHLMYVIGRIEDLGYTVQFFYRECVIEHKRDSSPLPRCIKEKFYISALDPQLRKIVSAYRAVIQFVHLYNKHNN